MFLIFISEIMLALFSFTLLDVCDIILKFAFLLFKIKLSDYGRFGFEFCSFYFILLCRLSIKCDTVK